MDTKAEENLKQLYQEALARTSYLKDELKTGLCFVPAVCGRSYRNAARRVMVVGRAPNGWTMPRYEDGGASPETWLSYGLSWVYAQKGSNGEDILCRDQSLHEASVRHSKFWQFIRYYLLARGIVTAQEKERFADGIVWSNLYKISFEEGEKKNPTRCLRNATAELCDKMLLAEIEYYDPDEVWFITRANGTEQPDEFTGCQWFCRGRFDRTIDWLCKNAADKKSYIFQRPESAKFEEIASAKIGLSAH